MIESYEPLLASPYYKTIFSMSSQIELGFHVTLSSLYYLGFSLDL
jgi:hypothetical protein